MIPNTAASAPTQIPTIFKMAPVDSTWGENNQSLLCSLYKLARVDKHQRDKNKKTGTRVLQNGEDCVPFQKWTLSLLF